MFFKLMFWIMHIFLIFVALHYTSLYTKLYEKLDAIDQSVKEKCGFNQIPSKQQTSQQLKQPTPQQSKQPTPQQSKQPTPQQLKQPRK